MADQYVDGTTRVYWVSTISNTAAPTTTELNAGVALQSYITPDGLDISIKTDAIDTSALDSTQNTSAPGRRGDDISMTFKHQGDAAAPWTTFASKPSGYVVVRYNVASTTAFASGQKLYIAPCTAGDRAVVKGAANEVRKFTVPFFVTGAVQDAASVA